MSEPLTQEQLIHRGWLERVEALEAQLEQAQRTAEGYREALCDLHAEVEMAESVGICLPDRVPSLKAGELLALPVEGGGPQ